MESTPPPQLPVSGPVIPGGMPSRPEKAGGLAIASLVFSIMGLFCCSLPPIAGIVLGIVELRNIKKGKSSAKGQSMAKTGIIIGIAALVLNLILIVYLIVYKISSGSYYWEINTEGLS